MKKELRKLNDLESEVCVCGSNTVILSKFANTWQLVCSKCGDMFEDDIGGITVAEFYNFVYTHNRKDVQQRFFDDKFLLDEALRSKSIQEEGKYLKKKGFESDYAT